MPKTLRLLLLFAVFVALAAPRAAHADKVDRLIEQARDSNYKVRLSAILNLTRLRDPRAIPTLIRALADSEKTVRGVAAAGLGKIIDRDTMRARRDQAIAALRKKAKDDKDSFVRSQAKKAYNKLKKLEKAPVGGSGGAIYVDIGNMSDKSGSGGSLKALMRKTAIKTFRKKASSMRVGEPPSKRQLRKMKSFHIDGTITELKVKKSGSTGIVSCKVNMLLATYPKKSMFGFLNGGAKVQTGTSEKDLRYGREDCVNAVIADLVARKIIPTIQTRAR